MKILLVNIFMSANYSKESGTVIILDALGIKGIWKNHDPFKILEKWDRIVDSLPYDGTIAKKKGIELTYYTFSDNLYITFTNAETNEILIEASKMLSALISYGITKGFYFRGAISIGDFYKSDRMLLGEPIDEAAMYYEKPNWIGVMATPSVERILVQSEKRNEKVGLFCRYQIPTHNGKISGWAIELGPEHSNYEQPLIDIAKKNQKKSEDKKIVEKWKNTSDFLEYVEKNTNYN